MFGTKGFLIAMHVPTTFVKYKNKITRALYRIAKSGVDIKKNGVFLMILKIYDIIISNSFNNN